MIELRDYNDYCVGVDLGQASDYTAIAVVEEPVWIVERWAFDLLADKTGWVSPADLLPSQVHRARAFNQHYGRPAKPPLHLRHLERMRHVGYPVVIDRVRELLARPPLSTHRTALLVDFGGVGRAVVDQMEQAGLRPYAVTITGGEKVTVLNGGRELRTPKRELIAATQLALQSGRLSIAQDLPDAATLVAELLAFRVKISAAGHDSYEARTGEHDDMVLAASLAVWYREWWNYNMDAAQQAAVTA